MPRCEHIQQAMNALKREKHTLLKEQVRLRNEGQARKARVLDRARGILKHAIWDMESALGDAEEE